MFLQHKEKRMRCNTAEAQNYLQFHFYNLDTLNGSG